MATAAEGSNTSSTEGFFFRFFEGGSPAAEALVLPFTLGSSAFCLPFAAFELFASTSFPDRFPPPDEPFGGASEAFLLPSLTPAAKDEGAGLPEKIASISDMAGFEGLLSGLEGVRSAWAIFEQRGGPSCLRLAVAYRLSPVRRQVVMCFKPTSAEMETVYEITIGESRS